MVLNAKPLVPDQKRVLNRFHNPLQTPSEQKKTLKKTVFIGVLTPLKNLPLF